MQGPAVGTDAAIEFTGKVLNEFEKRLVAERPAGAVSRDLEIGRQSGAEVYGANRPAIKVLDRNGS